MSNDPSDSGGDVPPSDPRDPFGYYPDVPRLPVEEGQVKARLQPPAIALIVVAVLNLLFALYMLVNSVITTVTPARQLYETQKQLYEAFLPGMAKELANKSPDEVKDQALMINWPLTVITLIGSVLTLLGAVAMLRLRVYSLAVMGSVAAAIPCVSCTACCGLGEGFGIWALVVLMNEEVKAAFR